MEEDLEIIRMNIAHYKAVLKLAMPDERRAAINGLLAEAQAKLTSPTKSAAIGWPLGQFGSSAVAQSSARGGRHSGEGHYRDCDEDRENKPQPDERVNRPAPRRPVSVRRNSHRRTRGVCACLLLRPGESALIHINGLIEPS